MDTPCPAIPLSYASRRPSLADLYRRASRERRVAIITGAIAGVALSCAFIFATFVSLPVGLIVGVATAIAARRRRMMVGFAANLIASIVFFFGFCTAYIICEGRDPERWLCAPWYGTMFTAFVLLGSTIGGLLGTALVRIGRVAMSRFEFVWQ